MFKVQLLVLIISIEKLPAQRPLVTDVIDEYGQLQVKSVALDDEHEPP